MGFILTLTFGSIISSLVSFCIYNFFPYLGILFFLQAILQLITAGIKHFWLKYMISPKSSQERVATGIPFIRSLAYLLGLTGDNSPKKRIIEHEAYLSFALPFIAFIIHLYFVEALHFIIALIFSAGLTYLMKVLGIFFLAKNYSESGFGINFYLNGWRILGIDFHSWIVKQDPITGNPLLPEDQYESPPRLHLDIPPINLHHWPYEQHLDEETTNSLMNAKAEMRAEKKKSKLIKKERRAEQIKEREEKIKNGGDAEKSNNIPEEEVVFDSADFF